MIFATLFSLAVTGGAARADDPPTTVPPEESPPAAPPTPMVEVEKRKTRVGGIGLPLVSINAVDGLGFGLGGEIYTRSRDEDFGYRLKVTAAVYANIRFDYNYELIKVEHRGPVHWLGTIQFRLWDNASYAGSGGADIFVDWGDRELGNRVLGPQVFFGGSKPIPGTPLSAYGLVYVRAAWVRPGEDTRLGAIEPLGSHGGGYADVAGGLEIHEVDRWPLPTKGWHAEAGLRIGASYTKSDGVLPVGGIFLEGIRWQPIYRDWLVLGTRVVVSKNVGHTPFFEQDVLGGRWRDEIGLEQMLVGYGRTRTRGDGVVAGLVEIRPQFGRIPHKFFDFTFLASAFVEEAWLFDEWDPGPSLPSIGGGPVILFQRAIVLRPFVALGWRADEPGGRRHPGIQYGVSLVDPL